MSRCKSPQWMLGIVSCLLIAVTASVGHGQDYLDLPEDVSQGGPSSLADKLVSLKDKFRRDNASSNRTTSNNVSRSKSRHPRYRSTGKASTYSSRTRQNNNARQQPKQLTSGMESRAKSNDLLPVTKMFSRSDKPLPQPSTRQAKRLKQSTGKQTASRATNKPRTVTKKPSATPPRVARLSPATSRANELDAALADLLQTKPVAKPKQAPLRSAKKSATVKSPVDQPAEKTPAADNDTFDLRQALLDDEQDSIASEVAEAVEEAIEPELAVTTPEEQQPEAVEAPVETVEPIDVVPQVETEPAATEVQSPTLVEPPKPAIIDTVEDAPKAIEPIVIATPPKPAITIAKPRKSPVISTPPTPNVAVDPFESTAQQVFGSPQQSSNPMRPFTAATPEVKPEPILARPESGVLQTTQQPVIVSHVEGPRSILVGREATYQVTLENTSSTGATQLSAQINVPEWAELVDAMSTSGVVERSNQGANAGVLEWKLNELAPRSSQALRLRLIPRSGRPLQLGVRWSQAPVQAQAVVEVQEPKLEIAISGPQEVHFGKPQRYRLTLRNPGTGLTEKVVLRLVPPGGNPQSATTQTIGNLKAGEVKDLDLELTAREAGDLLIQASAIAEGGLTAETTKSVLCRKPELKVDWRGPDKKYAGTVAAYYFRVQNPGTAPTEPVAMSVKLPVGAEFVSASDGYSINTATGVVSWRLAGIDVNEEQFMQLRCKIARPGNNDFEVVAKTTNGELTDSKAFHTDVVALADLKLEVTDPQGPLPIGESVVYEIRVRNRGTTNAENINIVGLFSEGIDPTTVEGAQFSVRDGRVSFYPIKSLPAGREVLLRIHAKASQVGTHIFRTEVTCPKLDIKLAAEETTRFFEDEHRWEDGETPYTAERQDTIQR